MVGSGVGILKWCIYTLRSDLRSHFIERQLEKAVALVGGKLVYLVLQEVGAELSTELWALVLRARRIPRPRPT